jgi:hypothetical protein
MMPLIRPIVLLVIAAALLVAAPAGSAKAPAKCARAGSTTIVKSKTARVYEVDASNGGTTLFGCLYSNDKRVELESAYDDQYVSSYGYDRVRLAGRFVAWRYTSTDVSCKADCPPGYEPTTYAVKVFDLKARKGKAVASNPAGQTLKLNSGGAAAWLVRLGNSQREVHAWDSTSHRVLDSGPISSKTFALDGPNLTWVNGDVQHTVPLS